MRDPITTTGTGQSESSASFQSIESITTTIPMSLKNCTTTSCVMRSINACKVAVSPLIRLITEPVEVRS